MRPADSNSTLPRLFTRLLVQPENIPASHADLEVIGTFNPAVIRVADEYIMLVRVVERPRDCPPHRVVLPRWDNGELVLDVFREDEVEYLDPRVVRMRSSGFVRLTFVSHLSYLTSRDGLQFEYPGRIALRPERKGEEFGVEDPRITKLDDTYYITYVAVSRHGAATALAATRDFKNYERLGIIFCPENKDVVLFPEKIGGQFVALHRPNGSTPFTKPEMWIARSDDLLYWGRHEPLSLPAEHWQSGRVGAGAPPVRTERGWLEIFHANVRPTQPGEVGAYHGAAMLLDADNPARVLASSARPLLSPEESFETTGFVNHVVFPTAVVESNDLFLVYYGAADAFTAVAGFSRHEVMESLNHGVR